MQNVGNPRANLQHQHVVRVRRPHQRGLQRAFRVLKRVRKPKAVAQFAEPLLLRWLNEPAVAAVVQPSAVVPLGVDGADAQKEVMAVRADCVVDNVLLQHLPYGFALAVANGDV